LLRIDSSSWRFFGAVIYYSSLRKRHTTSWPHTLTDWCVIRAFERAGCPGCLRKPPALAAAFVGEVSKAVRFRTFSLREAELPVRLEAAAESACELAGGDAYRAVRDAATDAEHEYHHSITRTGHCPQRYARHERCSTAVAIQRQQFQAEINSAQRRFVRAYWAEQRQHWLRSDPFAHLRREHPIQRIATFTPCLVGIVPPLSPFGISPARPCPISPARRPCRNSAGRPGPRRCLRPWSRNGARGTPTNLACRPNSTTMSSRVAGRFAPALPPVGSIPALPATLQISPSLTPPAAI
jgi:hypothetical protein